VIQYKIFTNLNITWAYFDIGDFNSGAPYLDFVNKYHPKFGDESTIVALNMLNGMYYGYRNEPKIATSFFEKAILLGKKRRKNQIYLHIRNILSFIEKWRL
jgi:hypothetical protein